MVEPLELGRFISTCRKENMLGKRIEPEKYQEEIPLLHME